MLSSSGVADESSADATGLFPGGSGQVCHFVQRQEDVPARRRTSDAATATQQRATDVPHPDGPDRAPASPSLAYGYLRVPRDSPDSRTQFLIAALKLSAFDSGAAAVLLAADHEGNRNFARLAALARASGARRVLVPSLDHLDALNDGGTGTGNRDLYFSFNEVVPVWPDACTARHSRDLISGPETRFLQRRGEILVAEHRWPDGGCCAQCLRSGPCEMRLIGEALAAGWRGCA